MSLHHSDERRSFLLQEWEPISKNQIKILNHRGKKRVVSESEGSSGSSICKDLSQLGLPKGSQREKVLEPVDQQTILSKLDTGVAIFEVSKQQRRKQNLFASKKPPIPAKGYQSTQFTFKWSNRTFADLFDL
jgi:hypothetical protein